MKGNLLMILLAFLVRGTPLGSMEVEIRVVNVVCPHPGVSECPLMAMVFSGIPSP